MSIKMKRTLYLGMSALMLAPLAESTVNPIMANAKRRKATYRRRAPKRQSTRRQPRAQRTRTRKTSRRAPTSYNKKYNYGHGVKMSPKALRRAGGYSRNVKRAYRPRKRKAQKRVTRHRYTRRRADNYSVKLFRQPKALKRYNKRLSKKYPKQSRRIKASTRKSRAKFSLKGKTNGIPNVLYNRKGKQVNIYPVAPYNRTWGHEQFNSQAVKKIGRRKVQSYVNSEARSQVAARNYRDSKNTQSTVIGWGDGGKTDTRQGGGYVSLGNDKYIDYDTAASAYNGGESPSVRNKVLSLDASPVDGNDGSYSDVIGSATPDGISFNNTSDASSASSDLDSLANSNMSSAASQSDGLPWGPDLTNYQNAEDNQQALDTFNSLNISSPLRSKLLSAYNNDPSAVGSAFYYVTMHKSDGTPQYAFDGTNKSQASSALSRLFNGNLSSKVSDLSNMANNVNSASSDNASYTLAPNSSVASSMNTKFSEAGDNLQATTNPGVVESAVTQDAQNSAASGMLKDTSLLANKVGNSKLARATTPSKASVVNESNVPKEDQAIPFTLKNSAIVTKTPNGTKLAMTSNQITRLNKKPGYIKTFMPLKQAVLSDGEQVTKISDYSGKHSGWIATNDLSTAHEGRHVAIPKGIYHFKTNTMSRTYALPVNSASDNMFIARHTNPYRRDNLHITAARKVNGYKTYYIKDYANPSIDGWVGSDQISHHLARGAKSKNNRPVKSHKGFTMLNLNVIGSPNLSGSTIKGNGIAGEDRVKLPKNFNRQQIRMLKNKSHRTINWNAFNKAFFNRNKNMHALHGSTEYYEQNGHDVAIPKNDIANAVKDGKHVFHFNYYINVNETKHVNRNAKNGDIIKIFYNRRKVNDRVRISAKGHALRINQNAASKDASQAAKAKQSADAKKSIDNNVMNTGLPVDGIAKVNR